MTARSPRLTSASSPRSAARSLFRNAILDAAERVFGKNGFHASRIQDVAAEAGVGVGTVYNHFRQKEDVLRALLEERTEEAIRRLHPVEGEPDSFEERLNARMSRFLEYLDQHRGYFRLFMAFGVMPEMADDSMRKVAGSAMKKMEAMKKVFAALIEEGVDAGALSDRFEAPHLASFLGATMRAIVFRGIAENVPSLVPHASEITELFLHGATARPRGGTKR